MTERKKTYKKGMVLFHNQTKKKIVFGKWNDDGTAGCVTDDKRFIKLTREEIDQQYTTYSSLDKKYRESRRGQCW